jgi:hypothetical protein
MGSPPHRALLLAPNATKLGVGVACNGTEHDAVAWIETQTEAQNAPEQPVVTKAGTGTRCNGTSSQPPATSRTTTAPAVAPTTAATSRRVTTTAAGPSPTTKRSKSTTTTSGRRSATAVVNSSDAGGGARQSRVAQPASVAAANPFSAAEVSRAAPLLLSGSQRPVRAPGLGNAWTIALVAGFIGALLLGRRTHAHR